MIAIMTKIHVMVKIKRRVFLVLSLTTLLGISVFYFFKQTERRDIIRLSVSFLPFKDRPTVQIPIEGRNYSLMIDLGSNHPIDLYKESIVKIKNKTADGTTEYTGMLGKSYPVRRFLLNRLTIQGITIQDLPIYEESLDFLQDAQTWTSAGLWQHFKDCLDRWTLDGRIGWPIFSKTVVFFRFPKSEIIISKNIPSLEKSYSLSGFTQSPFEINWGPMLIIETDLGKQRFLLDTGATGSLIKMERDPNKQFYSTKQFKIGNHDFGPCELLTFPFTDQMECDGILGIDFFKKHSVCLDFPNMTVYISH